MSSEPAARVCLAVKGYDNQQEANLDQCFGCRLCVEWVPSCHLLVSRPGERRLSLNRPLVGSVPMLDHQPHPTCARQGAHLDSALGRMTAYTEVIAIWAADYVRVSEQGF